MDKQRIMTFRMDEALGEILDYIGRIENKPVSELIREMIKKNIEEYRSNAEFKERLKKRVEIDQGIFNRLMEE